MANTTITESGMTFGPFQDSSVFQIEKSTLYTSKFRPHGIKTCEFVLQRNRKLYFIEAKKSCPNQEAAMSDANKREKYDEYIHDIAQKMRDSLHLYTSILLKCNQSNELSGEMDVSDLSDLKIRFVLVVKEAEPEWLIHYPDIFQNELRNEMKIWKIPSFAVITEAKAREKQLLIPATDNT